MNRTTTPDVVHSISLRESAEIRVEVLDDGRVRLGLWRRSPASDDPMDFTMTSGFALDVPGIRELRSALALAVAKVEGAAEE